VSVKRASTERSAKEGARVLVVDDHLDMAEMVADGLARHGYEAVAYGDPRQAADEIALGRHVALVTDLRMNGLDGLDLLARSRAAAEDAPVILMTAFSGVDSAIESIRRGAYHYLTKPFKIEELALFLGRALDELGARREARSLARALRATFSLDHVIGDSPLMRDLAEVVRRVADADVPVLVLGETGTGKGLVARALHAESGRSDRPFFALNCAAVPETLLESELFGHTRGAFTGATAARSGIFRDADGGTLFLDEIGEMSPALQAKLLHVLETSRVRPLGESKEHPVDVRIVAATHRDLAARVREGAFREDLLYRLDVVSLEIPALRHRREDVPRLVDHFFETFREKHPRAVVRRFSREAMARLSVYAFPGNVRELSHAVERAVLLGRDEEAGLDDLPPSIRDPRNEDVARIDFGDVVLPLREMQKRYVAHAFERLGQHKGRTCEALGIDWKTLARWLE
jgi:two-component system response regulator HydG